MVDYRRAPEVEKIANRLISDVPAHVDLGAVHVEYVFRDPPKKSKGRTRLGSALKLTGRNAFLFYSAMGTPDHDANRQLFVVEIAEKPWRRMEAHQREALVDHELCHCRVDIDEEGQPSLSVVGHDLEEFGAIVDRHGLWQSDLAAFGSQVADQLTLAMDEADDFLREVTEDPDADEGGAGDD